jgi:glutathione S-transferase
MTKGTGVASCGALPPEDVSMATLYFSPAACSLSPHIVLREAGMAFTLEQVDLRSKALKSGGSLTDINPKGQVPTLTLDGGEVLTEGPAIVQWIADQVPAKHLAPANGTMDRTKLQIWLNYISTEIHKGFSPLFSPTLPAETKSVFAEMLLKKLAWVDGQLAGKDYLMGAQFTVADAYLFTVANWSHYVKLDISGFANLQAHMGRVAARPAVQEAMKAEGLVK